MDASSFFVDCLVQNIITKKIMTIKKIYKYHAVCYRPVQDYDKIGNTIIDTWIISLDKLTLV